MNEKNPTRTQNPARTQNPSVLSKPLAIALLALLIVIIAVASIDPISHAIEHLVSTLENHYQSWLGKQHTNNPVTLLPMAFVGGLIASISPCILAMLPLNLSYIGTREITSRWDALIKAGSFVLGVVTVLSLFGLVSGFAGSVLVEYRGYINLLVGAIIVIMGLLFSGIIKWSLPQLRIPLGAAAGPYGVGITFALVSSPCASPVLFAVLTAAAATGSKLLSTLTMISYSLGYTAVIFLSSLFTGLVKQSKVLLVHSQWVVKFGGVTLILVGGYYLVTGVRWFL